MIYAGTLLAYRIFREVNMIITEPSKVKNR